MIEQILVVEPDNSFSDKLVDALRKAGPYHVVSATDLVEASLLLSRQSRDLAFIPLSENDNIVAELRAIQPDLRLVLTTPSAETSVPEAYLGKVQAVLLKTHLESDLYIVLKSAVTNPIVIEEDGKPRTGELLPPLETAVIIAALQRAELGNLVQTAVFAYKTDLLAHWGELNITQAATIALVVGDKWHVEEKGTLVQFIHLAARAGDLLLYTREVEENYLLTLVAQPGTSMRELRHTANELVASLAKVLKGQSLHEAGVEAAAAAPNNGNQKTYAIVWRPIRPIPQSLHIPLRRAIERLATANACSLSHISVHEKLIHLVVSCPPGRDSSWAVFLFKNGSEDTIQREYGVAASLWDTGHYAIESTQPLSEAELNLFLEKENDSY